MPKKDQAVLGAGAGMPAVVVWKHPGYPIISFELLPPT